MENLKNNMVEDKCSRCGECCGLFIPFNDDDILRIRKYVQLHNIKPFNRIDLKNNTFKAHCCFYDENKKECTIYAVRPYVCRDFRCDRKDWKKYRDIYEKQCKYNSSFAKKTILATFDDMIYNDYGPIIKYLLDMIMSDNGNVDELKFYNVFKSVNRLDILEKMTLCDDNDNTITGKEFIERYKKSNNENK